jgi:hypothetical protein
MHKCPMNDTFLSEGTKLPTLQHPDVPFSEHESWEKPSSLITQAQWLLHFHLLPVTFPHALGHPAPLFHKPSLLQSQSLSLFLPSTEGGGFEANSPVSTWLATS